MGTKQFSNYSDLLTFTRASKGHALRPVSYGDELVTNGTFDDSSALNDWEEFSGTLSVASQKLRVTQTTGSNPSAGQTVNTTVGKIYLLTVDYFPDDANAQILVKSTNINGSILYNEQNLTSDGTYRNVFVATKSSIYIQLVAQSSTTGHYAEFDNISVKEVTFDQPDGTLTLFEHPNNVPRVEWDADRNRLGLLVEEQRINLFTYSEDFSNSYYNVKIRTRTLEATQTGPDGATSAYVFGDDSSGGTNNIILGKSSVALVTNTTYTWSLFAKKDGLNWIALSCVDFGGITNGFTHFDLENGAVGSTQNNITAKIQEYPNDWYRCSVTFTTNGTDATGNLYLYIAEADNDRTVDLDGTSSVLIYGAQLEAGSFPTSYIKSNSGSTTTRSADVASIPVADFGYNQSAGTVSFDFQVNESTSNKRLLSLNADNSSNRIDALLLSSNEIQGYTVDGGVVQTFFGTGNTYTDGTMAKFAFSYKKDDYAMTLNGGTVVTDTSASVPSVTQLEIGTGPFNDYANGHIKKLMYIPRRVTNAQLISLTE